MKKLFITIVIFSICQIGRAQWSGMPPATDDDFWILDEQYHYARQLFAAASERFVAAPAFRTGIGADGYGVEVYQTLSLFKGFTNAIIVVEGNTYTNVISDYVIVTQRHDVASQSVMVYSTNYSEGVGYFPQSATVVDCGIRALLCGSVAGIEPEWGVPSASAFIDMSITNLQGKFDEWFSYTNIAGAHPTFLPYLSAPTIFIQENIGSAYLSQSNIYYEADGTPVVFRYREVFSSEGDPVGYDFAWTRDNAHPYGHVLGQLTWTNGGSQFVGLSYGQEEFPLYDLNRVKPIARIVGTNLFSSATITITGTYYTNYLGNWTTLGKTESVNLSGSNTVLGTAWYTVSSISSSDSLEDRTTCIILYTNNLSTYQKGGDTYVSPPHFSTPSHRMERSDIIERYTVLNRFQWTRMGFTYKDPSGNTRQYGELGWTADGEDNVMYGTGDSAVSWAAATAAAEANLVYSSVNGVAPYAYTTGRWHAGIPLYRAAIYVAKSKLSVVPAQISTLMTRTAAADGVFYIKVDAPALGTDPVFDDNATGLTTTGVVYECAQLNMSVNNNVTNKSVFIGSLDIPVWVDEPTDGVFDMHSKGFVVDPAVLHAVGKWSFDYE